MWRQGAVTLSPASHAPAVHVRRVSAGASRFASRFPRHEDSTALAAELRRIVEIELREGVAGLLAGVSHASEPEAYHRLLLNLTALYRCFADVIAEAREAGAGAPT